MAFEFGMFHEFQRTAGITDEQAFATSFEEMTNLNRFQRGYLIDEKGVGAQPNLH